MSDLITRRRLLVQGTKAGVVLSLLPSEGGAMPALAWRGIIALGRRYFVPAVRFAGKVVAGWLIERQLDRLLKESKPNVEQITLALDAMTVQCPTCSGLHQIYGFERARHASANMVTGFECAGENCGRQAEIEILPAEFLEGVANQVAHIRRFRTARYFTGAVSPRRGDILGAKYSGVGLYCNTDPRNPDLQVRSLQQGDPVLFLGLKPGTYNTLHVYDPSVPPEKRYLWADARGFYRQDDGKALWVNQSSTLNGPLKETCADTAREQACNG